MSVVVFRAVLEAFGDTAEHLQTLLAALGIDEATLRDPDGRFPIGPLYDAQDAAARITGDDDFGLHVGERAPIGALETIDVAVRSSRNVRDGLVRAIRLFALITDDTYLELGGDGRLARLAHRPAGRYDIPRHGAEMVFSAIVTRARSWTDEMPLQRVRFAHRAPPDAREHARIFQAAVEFGAPVNELVFDGAWLETPLRTADPRLSAVLDRFAAPVASAASRVDLLLSRVRSSIVEALKAGDASVRAVARRLGSSPRSLQRHLCASGTSYQEVLDGVRREIATARAADTRMTVTELAELLGFSRPAALHRAFKRWTGRTVLEYRAEHACT
jgi:AraC-like DNA-binding protein